MKEKGKEMKEKGKLAFVNAIFFIDVDYTLI